MTKNNSSEDSNKSTEKMPNGLGRGIMGIVLALVVVSIAYSSTFILLATDETVPHYMIVPQAIFAIGVLGYAFYKIFK